jgi:hypothetical protein
LTRETGIWSRSGIGTVTITGTTRWMGPDGR